MRGSEWGRGVEGGKKEREREKESTCGSHYSVGQDTVVLHGEFCQGELVAKSWRKSVGKVGVNTDV